MLNSYHSGFKSGAGYDGECTVVVLEICLLKPYHCFDILKVQGMLCLMMSFLLRACIQIIISKFRQGSKKDIIRSSIPSTFRRRSNDKALKDKFPKRLL